MSNRDIFTNGEKTTLDSSCVLKRFLRTTSRKTITTCAENVLTLTPPPSTRPPPRIPRARLPEPEILRIFVCCQRQAPEN